MKQTFPATIGIGAGIGMVFAIALFGSQALVWGLIIGAALGTVSGAIMANRK